MGFKFEGTVENVQKIFFKDTTAFYTVVKVGTIFGLMYCYDLGVTADWIIGAASGVFIGGCITGRDR